MDKKFEILEVLPNDLTTSYENGECLIFLELKTLRRDEEKSGKAVSGDTGRNWKGQ